jgi:alkylation response protein AidB-like acyl-CoA dehydrogenase
MTPGPDRPGPITVDEFTAWCDRARTWPRPGSGETVRRFRLLFSLARSDLVLGRLVEAHADAVAIIGELTGDTVSKGQRWGVWAAGPPDSLVGVRMSGGWAIEGTKKWCSGATLVDHVLVDASTSAGQQLFAVDLTHPGISILPAAWAGPGMIRADTRAVTFESVNADPVGRPGQYLSRRGFWAGAVGVASCWHGGTVKVADALLDPSIGNSNPHVLAHAGAVYVALSENRAVLNAAARQIDCDRGEDLALVARATRTTIERNAVEIIDRVGRALGPAPLAHDAVHAATVADLAVYVRQHHAERDLEQIGRDLTTTPDGWSNW